MPPFRDDQIIIIAPGSHTTLAQLGLPESFTPARFRLRSCMFRAEKQDEWEPYKIQKRSTSSSSATGGQTGNAEESRSEEKEGDGVFEEDVDSLEGAVWPIHAGKITNWSCFFALMQHVFNALNPPFHTPILLVAQPSWTPRDHEKLTQFFFEKFKPPAFSIIDSAQATCNGFGIPSATVVDVGADKTDITAVSEFLVQDIGRAVAIPNCGGEAFTQRLLDRLKGQAFTREMCNQLKRNPICEVLSVGVPLPKVQAQSQGTTGNPATAVVTGGDSSATNQQNGSATLGDGARANGGYADGGGDLKDDDDQDGVIDVASIVAGGKTNEFLAKKEKEKAEKAAAKKKGADSSAAQARQVRLKNIDKQHNTFYYEQTNFLADANKQIANGPIHDSAASKPLEASSSGGEGNSATRAVAPTTARREVSVGLERFITAEDDILDTMATAIHRTILSVPEAGKRSDLWDNIIVVGNGAKVRGFSEALLSLLNAKFLISPSSATIFTSELPSNLSTPLATGANTPQHPSGQTLMSHGSHGVNPLLLAATTASAQTSGQHLHPSAHANPYQSHHGTHYSHGQTPTSIKLARLPEYFPEWKDVGSEEASFLGAQVAAKVLFVVDQGVGKGYMTRPDYNDQGPTGIHDYIM